MAPSNQQSTIATPQSTINNQQSTILIVEDDQKSLYIARVLMEKEGFQVIEAKDGLEALEMASQHVPDLILMDMQLPLMDGYEATRRIKADKRLAGIPVVALTAHAMRGDREKTLEAGCSGYIPKPIDPYGFGKEVKKYLREDRKMNLLIVDDNKESLYMLETLLKTHGHQVVSARNGAEALERLRSETVDVIISDILMPVMDGFQLCRRVRGDERLKKIPFVFYTATYTDQKDEEFASHIGADRFIRKPVEPDHFLKIIDDMITDIQWGRIVPKITAPEENGEDLRLYSERLVKKLEKKMLDLEREIIERKKTEKMLRESEERYRLHFENVSDVIYAIGPELEVLSVSPSIEKFLGYKPEELVGRPFPDLDIVPPDQLDEAISLVQSVFTGGNILSATREFTAKDGRKKFGEVNGTAILEDGKVHGMVAVVRDITERRKMEEELLKMEKLESIGILAGGLAHDFNNILSIIMGNVSLAKMDLKPEEDAFEMLAEAERAAARAQDITKQLLTFARGGAPIKALASVFDIVRETSLFVLRGSKTGCDFHTPDDLWATEVDSGQISQVVQNLVLNADQAMPEGGVIRIDAENSVIASGHGLPLQPGKYVRISFQDQGIGIPEKHLIKIFDPYFSSKEKGRGLGLATAYSIIKRHGGHLTVESRLNVGTTFHIYLPALAKQPPMETVKAEGHLEAHGKILIMDDEEGLRKVAGRMLERLGYEMGFAADGAEAIALFKAARESGTPYDLVILDLTIPGGMGGKEAIGKLREIDPGVKTIVSSGYSNDPVMSNFREYGFQGVVPKPFDRQALAKTVHDVITETV